MAVGLFLLALAVYLASNPDRPDFYDHFVWQADAFLHGRAEIEYPVTSGPFQNGHFQDVLPVSADRGLLPFPPLPAVVLLPVVAVWGLGTNGGMAAAGLGALNVALCWLTLLGVTPRRSAALLGTLFYGFGTVAWYAANARNDPIAASAPSIPVINAVTSVSRPKSVMNHGAPAAT